MGCPHLRDIFFRMITLLSGAHFIGYAMQIDLDWTVLGLRIQNNKLLTPSLLLPS